MRYEIAGFEESANLIHELHREFSGWRAALPGAGCLGGGGHNSVILMLLCVVDWRSRRHFAPFPERSPPGWRSHPGIPTRCAHYTPVFGGVKRWNHNGLGGISRLPGQDKRLDGGGAGRGGGRGAAGGGADCARPRVRVGGEVCFPGLVDHVGAETAGIGKLAGVPGSHVRWIRRPIEQLDQAHGRQAGEVSVGRLGACGKSAAVVGRDGLALLRLGRSG